MTERQRYVSILLFTAVAYLVVYPEDFDRIISSATDFLSLTFAISPWFYGVVAIGLIAHAVIRIWGGKTSQDRSHLAS